MHEDYFIWWNYLLWVSILKKIILLELGICQEIFFPGIWLFVVYVGTRYNLLCLNNRSYTLTRSLNCSLFILVTVLLFYLCLSVCVHISLCIYIYVHDVPLEYILTAWNFSSDDKASVLWVISLLYSNWLEYSLRKKGFWVR